MLEPGATGTVLYGEAPPLGPPPYRHMYHFDRESTPLVFQPLKRGTSFAYSKTLRPFCKPLK